MLRKTAISIGTAAVLLIVISSFIRMHVIRVGSDATLLWNSHAAYLFINAQENGYRPTYLTYLAQATRNLLGGAGIGDPTDTRSYVVVWRITQDDTYRFQQESDTNFDSFVPLGEGIFANGGGNTWKWTGDMFVRATADEHREYLRLEDSFPPGFHDVGGWSEQYGVLARGVGETRFPLRIGDKNIILVASVGRDDLFDQSIDLLRPDDNRRNLWSSHGRPHLIGETEYGKIFKRR